jgi:hypothetical protein
MVYALHHHGLEAGQPPFPAWPWGRLLGRLGGLPAGACHLLPFLCLATGEGPGLGMRGLAVAKVAAWSKPCPSPAW